MADVIGRAVVTISPEFAGFRGRVTTEMTTAGQAAGRAFSNAFETGLRGLTPALNRLTAELRAVDAAAAAIDASDLRQLETTAVAATTALRATASAATTLDGALTSIDSSDLRGVETTALAGTAALDGMAAAALSVDAALTSIDTSDLRAVATAASAVTAGLDSAATAAVTLDGALASIDANDLTNASAAATALAGALDLATASAVALDAALASIDANDLTGVLAAATAAAAALGQVGAAATGADAGLAGIDSGDLSGVASAAASATASIEGIVAAALAADAALASIDSSDLAGVSAAANTATTSLVGTGAAASGASSSMALLKSGALVGGAALLGLGVAGVTIAGQMEQAQIAFTGLLGSQAAADEFLATLKEFSATTPFEFEQVLPATQKLIALGQTGEEAIDTLTIVGNAAAAVGASGESIDGVVTALAQIQAKGKLSAQELNQIAERLPNFDRGNFLDNLAADFGVTGEEIRKMAEQGEIAADRAIPVLLQSLEQVPGALGAMDRQSQSLLGRFSTLADNIKFGLATAFQDLADTISPQVLPLGETLQGTLEQVGSGIANLAAAVLPALVPLIELIGPLLGGALTFVATAIGPVVDWFGRLADLITPIASSVMPALNQAFSALMNVMRPVFDLLAPMAAAFLALMAAQKLTALSTTALSKAMEVLGKGLSVIANHPVIAVAAIIAGLFYGMWENSEALRNAVSDLGNTLSTALAPAFDAVRGVVASITGVEFQGFGEILGWLGDQLAVAVSWLAERVPGAVQAAGDAFNTYLRPALDAVVGFVTNAVDMLGRLWDVFAEGDDVAQGAGEVIDNIFGNTGALVAPVRDLTNTVLGFFGVLDGADLSLGGAGDALGSMVQSSETLSGVLLTVRDNFLFLWSAIGSGDLGSISDALGGLASSLANAASVLGPPLLTALGEAGAAAGKALADAIYNALFVELPKLLGNLGDAISGPLADGLQSALTSAASSLDSTPLAGIADSVASGLPDAFRSAGEGLGGLGDAIAGLPALFQSIGEAADQWLMPSLREIASAVGPILGALGEVITTDIIPAFQELWPIAQNVAEIVGKVLAVAVVGLAAAIAGLLDNGGLDFITGAIRGLGDAFRTAVEIVRGFTDVIAGLLSGDMDQVKEGLLGMAEGILGFFTAVLADLPKTITDFVGNIGQVIFGAFEDVPVLGELFETLKQVLGDVQQILGGVFDILGGIFTFDVDRIAQGIYNLADGILKIMGEALTALPEIIGDIISDGVGLITGGLAGIGDWIADNLSEIPVLGEAFETVGQIVNDVADGVGDIFTIIGGLLRLDFGQVGEGFKNLGTSLLGILREAITGIPEILFDVISDAVPVIGDALGGIGDWLQDAFSDVPIIGELFDEIGNIVTGVGDALSGVFDILAGIFTLDFGRVWEGIKELGGAIINVIGGLLANVPQLLADLGVLLWDGISAAFTAAWNWISTDGISLLNDILGGIPGFVLDALTGLGEIIVTAFSAAFDWLVTNGPVILTTIGGWLAEVPGQLIGFLGNLGELLVGFITGAFEWVVTNGPGILGGIAQFFVTLPLKVLEWLANMGATLVVWLIGAFDWLVQNGPIILTNITTWITSIPGLIIGWLAGLGELLGGWLTAAWDWVVTNGPVILTNITAWITSLPGLIMGWLGNLGEMLVGWVTGAWDWVVTNGPIILTNIAMWVQGLIGQFLGWIGNLGEALVGWVRGAWDWVVTNGPTILSSILNWVTGIPGQIMSALGDIGTSIFNWLKGAFDNLVTRGDELLSSLLTWAGGIPSAIVGAISGAISTVSGAVGDIAGDIWNGLKGWINQNLLDPIRNYEVNILTWSGRPFENIVPTLGEGMVVYQPMTAIIGEAGPEVVIPLTKPERARQLMEESGLMKLIVQPELAGPIPMLAEGGIINGPTLAVVGENGPEVVIPLSDPARAKELALASGLLDVVQTEGVQEQVALNMQNIASLGVGAVQPLLDWFVNFTPAVIAALITFGETVWGAVSGTFAFFAQQIALLFDTLLLRIQAWPGQVALALQATGTTIWTAMAPGMASFASSMIGVFDGIYQYVALWRDGIVSIVSSIPLLLAGIGGAVSSAMAAPLRAFAAFVWNPFVGPLNTALDQIPATAPINIPTLPTAHAGGIIGLDRLPGTGGPLGSDEMVVKMQRGEGVLPANVMRQMNPQQFRALQEGRFDLSYGRPEVIGNQIGQGPGGPGGSALAAGFLPDSIAQDLETAIRSLDGAVANIRSGAWYLPTFLTELFGRFSGDSLSFVRDEVTKHNEEVTSTIGLPPGTYPPGFDIEAWRGIFQANKRAGSYPIILQFLTAAGIPHIVSSAFRPGGTSYHASSRAVDLIGPNSAGAVDHPDFLRINQAFWPFLDGTITELIYAGPGGRTDKAYNAATMADHHDHVHVALAAGAYLKRPTYGLLAEQGPEVVIPLGNPDRALQLALDSGLFDVLAQARGGPLATPAPSAVPATVGAGATTPADAGFLGGGPGNTYNIFGVTMDQVRAEINARDAATLRSRP